MLFFFLSYIRFNRRDASSIVIVSFLGGSCCYVEFTIYVTLILLRGVYLGGIQAVVNDRLFFFE